MLVDSGEIQFQPPVLEDVFDDFRNEPVGPIGGLIGIGEKKDLEVRRVPTLPARCPIPFEYTSRFVEQSVDISGKVPQSGDRPLSLTRIDALALFDTVAHRGEGVECRLYAGECRLGICMNNVQLRDIGRRDDVLPANLTTFKSNIFDADPHDGPPRP
jgi:hypothetical protein